MLQLHDLTFRIGDRLLLDGAAASVPAGHRVGLVGRNGSGKTTLLRLIAGELAPESGTVRAGARSRIATLAQEAPDGDMALIDFVLAADRELSALSAEADTAHDPQRIADVHTRLADIGAHTAPARAGTILAGLGFDAAQQVRPLDAFSGGWRMRVALAALLFAEPDVLLLDEPSNHLDLEATLWLTEFLSSYGRTLILVSHDRDLLNAVPRHILHLERGRLTLYGGNYDKFEATRRARHAFQASELVKQAAQRQHMQAFVDRFRYKASKARQAQSRLKALAKLPPLEPIVEAAPVLFDLPDPEPLSPPLIALDRASVGYDGAPVLRGLNLRIDPDDRIALLGANGNGKSTLARLLAGRLAPMSGEVARARKLRVGYFSQLQAESLALDRTALDLMTERMAEGVPGGVPPTKVRAHLGRFGLAQERADTTARDLSGGETARLMLALATYDAPHLLILDEPSNHLDIDSREALVQALATFDGAVILVSHDPHLVALVADRLVLVEGGQAAPFDGDMADYRRHLLGRRAAAPPSHGLKAKRQAAATAREPASALRKAAAAAERRLEQLTAAKAQIDAALANPATYRADGTAAELGRKQAALAQQIAAAERSWITAHERLEALD